MQHYPPNEYVIWEGDLSTDMYFVVDGRLEVRMNVQASNDILAGLFEHNYICAGLTQH